MRDEAVAAGDQPYGAVVVMDGRIVGYGPSRVVSDRNPDAHAERVALWAAQAALGRKDLTGAVIYSTSIPCAACQRALAAAGVARMFHGHDATNAGAPFGALKP
jgi:tRNA(Arg) A34 adenosine deaminase TadA